MSSDFPSLSTVYTLGLLPLVVFLTACSPSLEHDSTSSQPVKDSSTSTTRKKPSQEQHRKDFDEILARARDEGHVHVLVELTVESISEGDRDESATERRKRRIQTTQRQLLSALTENHYTVLRRFSVTPMLALKVAETTLKELNKHPLTKRISLDRSFKPHAGSGSR